MFAAVALAAAEREQLVDEPRSTQCTAIPLDALKPFSQESSCKRRW